MTYIIYIIYKFTDTEIFALLIVNNSNHFYDPAQCTWLNYNSKLSRCTR